MGTKLWMIRAAVLGLLLGPGALQAGKVRVDCDSPNRPEAFWVVREAWADRYPSGSALLRSKIPLMGIRVAMGLSPNLPDGQYYLFPVCPGVGILPQGKLVSSAQEGTTIRCP